MDSIVHFEIPFDEKERAMKFYKEVFQWEIQDMPEMNYVITRTTEVDEKFMPKKSGAINGGMFKREDVNYPQTKVWGVTRSMFADTFHSLHFSSVCLGCT